MLLDAKALKETSVIDPQIIEWAKANPVPPLDWDDAPAVHGAMDMLSKQGLEQLGPPEASITEEKKLIAMRDGFQSSIKIHRPTNPPAGGSPLIVFCFGGGWISGDNDAGTPFARAFVRQFGAVAVNISYRLAPQYKFPISQYDGIDSVKWLSEHASEIGADPTKGFIVGGMSAGGQLTGVITTQALKNKLAHPITGQWLCIPSLMSKENVPAKYKDYYQSMDQNVDVPILPASAIHSLKRHTEWDEKSELRWPILADVPVSQLPPTYFQACGMDPIRDDALIYDEILKEAGVKTKIDLYPGAPHGHFALMAGIELSNRALGDAVTGVGWLLGKTLTPEQALGSYAPSS